MYLLQETGLTIAKNTEASSGTSVLEALPRGFPASPSGKVSGNQMRNVDDDIYFKESSSKAGDFLHEMNDPDLVRPAKISSDVMSQLRREQIGKMEENIVTLELKQLEFNRKMDDYIQNLRRLIESLQSSPRDEGEDDSSVRGTLVSCAACGTERSFDDLFVIYARESDETLDFPTECYVSVRGEIKKGSFSCRECGGDRLLIRSR